MEKMITTITAMVTKMEETIMETGITVTMEMVGTEETITTMTKMEMAVMEIINITEKTKGMAIETTTTMMTKVARNITVMIMEKRKVTIMEDIKNIKKTGNISAKDHFSRCINLSS